MFTNRKSPPKPYFPVATHMRTNIVLWSSYRSHNLSEFLISIKLLVPNWDANFPTNQNILVIH